MNNQDTAYLNIAQRCARILHGCHTREEPITARIGHTLACIPFIAKEDRIHLASRIYEFLAPMLEKEFALLDVNITPEGEDFLRITGEIKRY